jgi:hypothetical protein
MPEDGDPPRPTPRVDILRELAVVPVPAGGQDAHVAEPPELLQPKCPSRTLKGSNKLKSE